MSRAFDFNRELHRRTVEVENVRAELMLATKLESSELPAPQETPQGGLRIGRLSTKQTAECQGTQAHDESSAERAPRFAALELPDHARSLPLSPRSGERVAARSAAG